MKQAFYTYVNGTDNGNDYGNPLIFGNEKIRNAYAETVTNDMVVFLVATQTKRTRNKALRGRVVGALAPTKKKANTLDYVTTSDELNPFDWNDGQYKWPFCLLPSKVWVDEVPCFFRDFFEGGKNTLKNHQGAQASVQPVTDEPAAVKLLERLPEMKVFPNPKLRHYATVNTVHHKGGTKSSVIGARRRGYEVGESDPNREAYVYVAELVGVKISTFKIGWSYDPDNRINQLNYAMPLEVSGLHYKLTVESLPLKNANAALEAEQTIHKKFENKRVSVVSGSTELFQEVSHDDLLLAVGNAGYSH